MKIPSGFLMVLISFALVGCSGDSPDTAWWDAERERVEFENRLELASYRFRQAGGEGVVAEHARVERQNAALAAQLETARADVARLRSEVMLAEKEFAALQSKVTQEGRAALVGTLFPELRAGSGRTYVEARVAAINDAGVVIRHRDGSARLGWSDLDPLQRQLFLLDERAARAAVEEEARITAAYEAWLEQESRRLHQVAVAAPTAKRKVPTSKAPTHLNRTLAMASSPLREPARRSGGVSRTRSRSSNTYYFYGSYCSPYQSNVRYGIQNLHGLSCVTRERPAPPATVCPLVP